jgi:hypothetical protein
MNGNACGIRVCDNLPEAPHRNAVRYVRYAVCVCGHVRSFVRSWVGVQEGVDGVLGLSSGDSCNPSCEPSYLDRFWAANPWLPQTFALCLSSSSPSVAAAAAAAGAAAGAALGGSSGPTGSVDLGGVVSEHYKEPLVWLGMALERQLMVRYGMLPCLSTQQPSSIHTDDDTLHAAAA